MGTQAATRLKPKQPTAQVFTTPAVLPTNGVLIGNFSDRRTDVSKPRIAHVRGLRTDASKHQRDSTAHCLLLFPTKCRVIIQLDTRPPMVQRLHRGPEQQPTTITSTPQAVWSRGMHTSPTTSGTMQETQNSKTPSPARQLSSTETTNRQIPRSVLGDSRRHLCSTASPKSRHHPIRC